MKLMVPIGPSSPIPPLPEITEPLPDGRTRLLHPLPDVNILPEVRGDLANDLSRCIGR